MNSALPPERNTQPSFLPDFCAIRMVFVVVVVAELFAFVLVLSAWRGPQGFAWDELGIVSLFIQWVALSSAALLCVLRRWLSRLPDRLAGILSYLVVLSVTLILTLLTLRLHAFAGVGLSDHARADVLLRNLTISAIVSAVALRLLYLQHRQRAALQSEAQARIEALHARIRPHFLFNSMNTIASLIRTQPMRAEEAVEDLADLFRANLADARRLVSLEDEFNNAQRYLQIEQLRLGERLKVEWSLSKVPLDAQLPPLTLQPLLENAIYHGIERLAGGGTVAVQGSLSDGRITLTITNPVPLEAGAPVRRGHQMAVDNIRERLHFTFGGSGRLRVETGTKECRVELTFPVRSVEQ